MAPCRGALTSGGSPRALRGAWTAPHLGVIRFFSSTFQNLFFLTSGGPLQGGFNLRWLSEGSPRGLDGATSLDQINDFPEEKKNSTKITHRRTTIDTCESGMGTTQIPKDIYPEQLRTNRKVHWKARKSAQKSTIRYCRCFCGLSNVRVQKWRLWHSDANYRNLRRTFFAKHPKTSYSKVKSCILAAYCAR